jgi:DNA processing protein
MATISNVTVSNAAATLVLVSRAGADWRKICADIRSSRSAMEVLTGASGGQLGFFDSPCEIENELTLAEECIRDWSSRGISIASVVDDEYPARLLDLDAPPPFITWQGAQCHNDRHGVAIVGSRDATRSGRDTAHQFGFELAQSGVAVLSGLAAGIDTAAHRGALDADGRTVAVIGTGLLRSYPVENTELQSIIAQRGMVISQFLPPSPPTKFSFPMRNAVMSGLGAATFVVEAGAKSGARIQIRHSIQQGRETYFYAGLRREEWAQAMAEKHRIPFIDSPADLLNSLTTHAN